MVSSLVHTHSIWNYELKTTWLHIKKWSMIYYSIESKKKLSWKLDCRFMEPLTTGNYPQHMRSLIGRRLPMFSKEQSRILNGSFDFIGLNYYTSRYAANAPLLNNTLPCYLTDFLANITSKYIFIHHLNHH